MMHFHNRTGFFITVLFLGTTLLTCAQPWKPAGGSLTTRWTGNVTPQNAHREYPRPMMVRDEWLNLNGLWDYTIRPLWEEPGEQWQGKILVPFPVESALSGVKKTLTPEDKLWYRRTFTVPPGWNKQRILLHIEASDWETQVWVNGKEVGMHRGGYDRISLDITAALNNTGEQEIRVAVWDPSDAGYQPYGKQTSNPRTIWYTATSGLWQTVWLEPVPETAIPHFKIIPDIRKNELKIFVPGKENTPNLLLEATAYDKGKQAGTVKGKLNDTLRLPLNNPQLWSPDNPFLYDLVITLYNNNKKTDEIKSYFGMREISLGKDEQGVVRLLLNNKPLFQFGLLDQGFWPDGLYTAPNDEALKYDIALQKKMGFNMIRKHVKTEPERWYYWCDKMGMLVWQDMPSGDKRIGRNDTDIVRSAQSAYQYKTELNEMIVQHFNHPSIVVWVPFNEGWGQFATAEIAALVKKLDPTRLVNATSGWVDRNAGDMHDIHSYPGPDMPAAENSRAGVLGEYGGQALVIRDHLWIKDLSRAPGHIRTSQTPEDLQQKYTAMIDSLYILKKKGLAAAVYTQLSDVESEVNGLVTYDRAVIKIPVAHLQKIHGRLIRD